MSQHVEGGGHVEGGAPREKKWTGAQWVVAGLVALALIPIVADAEATESVTAQSAQHAASARQTETAKHAASARQTETAKHATSAGQTATANGSGPIAAKSLAAVIEPVLKTGMADEHIPGAAFVLVQDGRVVLSQGFGVADVASGRKVQSARTIFPIASISKVFTATALMQLAERGRIDLYADVNRYLKSVRLPDTYPQPITPAHLLTHTSGLDELPGRRVRSVRELMPLARFLKDRLVRVHPPGDVTSYSSYGLALGGLLIEDVSGQPFEQYLRHQIWQPLQMSNTFVTVPAGSRAELATAYELDDQGKPVAVPYEIYQTPPASSIVATAHDMARFMIAHLQNGRYGKARILDEATTIDMHAQHATMHPRIPGWSYGFQLDDTHGRRILEHGGDIGGFSALMTLLPDEGVGFYVVHHLESTNLRFKVRKAILDRFFPAPSTVVKPAGGPTQDTRRLARFAGTYRANNWCHSCKANDGAGDVQDFEVIAHDDGTLELWGTRWVEAAEPLYFVDAGGQGRRIGFTEDAADRIVAVTAGSWKVLERIDR